MTNSAALAPADLPLVSATQLSLFDRSTGCQRKWGFKYIDRIQTPKHPGALLGTEVQDEQLDPWLLTGRQFDFTRKSGEIALAISAILPRPMSPGMKLRRKFVIPSPTGRFAYQGEFDMWAASSSIVPGLDARRAVEAPGTVAAPLLEDTKTTGNLDFALTPETLRTDVQAQLYGAAIMYLDNVDELDAYWAYGRTRKPYRVQSAYLRMRAPAVFEQFERLDEIGAKISAIRLSPPKSANELPPNPRMCDQFGGCPYRHICNLSPAVHAAAVNQEALTMNNDFLANLRKQTGAPPAPAAPAAPPPAPAPVAPPAPAGNAWRPPSPLEYAAPPPAPAPVAPPAPAGNAWRPPSPLEYAAPPVVSTPTQAAAAGLPAWATAPVDPLQAQHQAIRARQEQNPGLPASAIVAAINPPESALPPAPPVGAAAPASVDKPKRGRPAKTTAATETESTPSPAESNGPTLEAMPDLANFMRENGIKKLGFFGSQVTEIEVVS